MKRGLYWRGHPTIGLPAYGLALLSCIAVRGDAHHSLASYDADRVVEISGTLKQAKVANPHSWLSVDAGSKQWSIETAGTAYVLRNIGGVLRDQFAPGQKVDVSFHPARNGTATGLLVKMRFADGRVLEGVPLK